MLAKNEEMKVREMMLAEVEAWQMGGMTKTEFLQNKDYSEAKFNYWIAKQKQQDDTGTKGFVELKNADYSNRQRIEQVKVLEIELRSGIKISVFA